MINPFYYFRPPFPPSHFSYFPSNHDIKNTASKDNLNDYTLQKENSKTEESAVFELFGIKLFNDDIIILSILLFLYTEKIQDQELFLILILLLLS